LEHIAMVKICNASAYALAIFGAAGMFAGCGGSQSPLTPSTATNAARVMPDRRPERFGYISNFDSGQVLVFEFPSGKSLGAISTGTEPQGECTKGRATWWVAASGSGEVEEFKVGGTTPIKALSVTAGEPVYCSVDGTTGDLAVTSLALAGDIVIFKDASGSGKEIADGLTETGAEAYDDKGDLFVIGAIGSASALVELPAGSSTFERITLPNAIQASFVQWDGRYLAVSTSSEIYRYSVSGSMATLEGTVDLACGLFWTEKDKIVCPGIGNNDAQVYAYPAGGSPLYTWTGNFDQPIGAVVVEK
jgi:hypothetical protein